MVRLLLEEKSANTADLPKQDAAPEFSVNLPYLFLLTPKPHCRGGFNFPRFNHKPSWNDPRQYLSLLTNYSSFDWLSL